MVEIKLITANDEAGKILVEIVECDRYTYDDVRKFVGGFFQEIETWDGKRMFVNEDGFERLPQNEEAYRILHDKYKFPMGCTPQIFGNAIVLLKGRIT